jgi:hypothetical protein
MRLAVQKQQRDSLPERVNRKNAHTAAALEFTVAVRERARRAYHIRGMDSARKPMFNHRNRGF